MLYVSEGQLDDVCYLPVSRVVVVVVDSRNPSEHSLEDKPNDHC